MARELGRTVVNSPLVKCAVAGNDPNVGRIVAAAGKFVGELDVNTSTKTKLAERLVIKMGGLVIFEVRGAMRHDPIRLYRFHLGVCDRALSCTSALPNAHVHG